MILAMADYDFNGENLKCVCGCSLKLFKKKKDFNRK